MISATPLPLKVRSDLRLLIWIVRYDDANRLPILAKSVTRGFHGDAVTRDFGITSQRR